MERILDLKSIKTNINIFFILVYTECTLNIFFTILVNYVQTSKVKYLGSRLQRLK